MKNGNCYKQQVDMFDLVVSEVSDFGLTHNRVYVVKDVSGANMIRITNDMGETDYYTTEYFRFYDGESVNSF